ncbi:MAG: hypothetical protein U0744_00010 [Gemmataceae bacterium]
MLRGCAAFMRNQLDHRPVVINPGALAIDFGNFNVKPFQLGRGRP